MRCGALSFTTLSYGNGVRIDVEEKLSCITCGSRPMRACCWQT